MTAIFETYTPTIYEALLSAIFSQASECGPTRSVARDGRTRDQSGQAHAPVRVSLRPVSSGVSTTNDTSGPTGIDLSKHESLPSSSASKFGPHGLYDPDRDAQIPTAWFDLVCADLEEAIYAVGVRDTPAAGSGAPHIRQRLFFVAQRLEHTEGDGRLEWGAKPSRGSLVSGCGVGGMVDSERSRLEGHAGYDGSDRRRQSEAGSVAASSGTRRMADGHIDGCDERIAGDARSEESSGSEHRNSDDRRGTSGSLANAAAEGREGRRGPATPRQRHSELGCRNGGKFSSMADSVGGQLPQQIGRPEGRDGDGPDSPHLERSSEWPGPVNGFWRNVDWLFCRDGKWRPVESGTFPLVDGAAFRVGSGSPFEGKSRQEILKGAGNAIVSEVAISFIEDYLEASGWIINSDDEIVVRA